MPHLRDALADALGPLYRVEREVRSIGDQRLFVATQLPKGPALLVKVLPGPRSLALDERRLEREILLLADRLAHPGLVAPRGAGRAAAHVFHTRAFIQGTTLRAWIARTGELPLTQAVDILKDVLAALAHAHAARVAHGDLRAEHVLLSERHAVVADTGIAGALGRAQTVGDPGPEPDPRDDMYAVGVLAHEMLTTRPPAVDAEPLARARSIPPWLGELLDRCLARDPGNRWADAMEALARVRPPPRSSRDELRF